MSLPPGPPCDAQPDAGATTSPDVPVAEPAARSAAAGPGQPGPRAAYPQARRLGITETLHGHPVADPYRWLERTQLPDDPDLPDPEVTAWARAQDRLFEEQAATWPGRERVAGRIRALLGAGTVGVPVWRGQRRFFVRREGSQEHAVLVVAEPGADGTDSERVLIDPMDLDPSGLTTLDSWQPSLEGDLLAYQLSAGGTEESVLRVMLVATGVDVDGPIDRARYSPVAWTPGGETFYYVRRLAPELVPDGEQQYHRRVYRHVLGTDPELDQEVFGAGLDLRSYYGVSVSRDGRWLTVSAATGTAPRNDVWIADLTAPAPETAEPPDGAPAVP
ncbi:MAG TPA: hypothetical protein VFP72_10960, partial [Kineosporiaceae bacterium]|nr:hypothetical protein [Kineosporiaceae bacterium]